MYIYIYVYTVEYQFHVFVDTMYTHKARPSYTHLSYTQGGIVLHPGGDWV